MAIAFCPHCGQPLALRPAFGRKRLACPRCDYVYFDDPKVATGVVVEREGRILLTRRAHEPMLGRWSFPSGYVDAGEVVEEAAVREVEEETGAVITIDRLLGVYSRPGERVIFVAYAGLVVGGEIRPGEEALEVRYFDAGALPELAFPHDDAIMAAWRAGRGAPARRRMGA